MCNMDVRKRRTSGFGFQSAKNITYVLHALLSGSCSRKRNLLSKRTLCAAEGKPGYTTQLRADQIFSRENILETSKHLFISMFVCLETCETVCESDAEGSCLKLLPHISQMGPKLKLNNNNMLFGYDVCAVCCVGVPCN